ncbi:MAG: glycosyltransferase family 39 protein [Chloroflexi bacterium]|nr:glycosyltransferase family 39 protein [Chloroflexota bacterium]
MQSVVTGAQPRSATAGGPGSGPRAEPAANRARLLRLATHPDVLLSLVVLVVALIPRLLYVVWAPPFIGGDSAQYFMPVYDLMTGGKFTLSLKRPPVYSWLIYASQMLFGPSFVPLIAFQHLLGAAGVVLTYWIGRLAWGGDAERPSVAIGRWAGGLAAVLVALSSPTLRWEHFLMTEGPFAFLFTLAMFLIVLGLRRPGWWPWAAAGLVLGVSILTRSAGQIAFFVMPPMVLLVERSWKSAIWKTGLAFAVCAVVTVPWMLRNQAVHGAFTTAGAAGQNLVTFVAIIHRPDFSFDEPLVTAVDADPKMAFARQQIKREMQDKIERPNKDVTGLGISNHIREETKMTEREADRAMQDIAMRAILARPLVYARHVAENVFDIFLADSSKADESLERQWRLWEEVSWNRQPLRRFVELPTPAQEAAFPHLLLIDSIYQPARTAGLSLALFVIGIGLALLKPRWRPVLAVALAALGLVAIHAATVGVVPRYRVSVEPLIDVTAMGALVVLASWGFGALRRRRPAA